MTRSEHESVKRDMLEAIDRDLKTAQETLEEITNYINDLLREREAIKRTFEAIVPYLIGE